MAEVGLLPLASVARRVGQAALPAYRRQCSPPRFQQPQLLAIFWLMRDEDWTFREAEVRVAEPRALRTARGVDRGPASTTLDRVLHRRDEPLLEQTLTAGVQRLLPQPSPQAPVTLDATGLASGAISTFVGKRAADRESGFPWRHGLNWPMAVAVARRVILAPTARRGPTHAWATLWPLVSAAHKRVPSGGGPAEAEFDSERTHPPLRQTFQAHRVSPAKRGGAAGQMQGGRAQLRQAFPADLDRRHAQARGPRNRALAWQAGPAGMAARRRRQSLSPRVSMRKPRS